MDRENGHMATARNHAALSPAQGRESFTTSIRVLHVDDEPDIREVVQISLGLDPDFETRSCSSGSEALASAADWNPDIILLDVMMPFMDGPATLVRLREHVSTANIPVAFMTVRALAPDAERFRSLGAVGVIPKPFNPMTLAAAVRAFVPATPTTLVALRNAFIQRMNDNAAVLAKHRSALLCREDQTTVLTAMNDVAHSLAGAAGIFGYAQISAFAAKLEESTANRLNDQASVEFVVSSIDTLLQGIEKGSRLRRS